ncbi:hypothetical protein J6590_010014 [Homalodisca vitripennis]|nr:hypothetical protein J6590_010014 [Homalodisca vitripennis]
MQKSQRREVQTQTASFQHQRHPDYERDTSGFPAAIKCNPEEEIVILFKESEATADICSLALFLPGSTVCRWVIGGFRNGTKPGPGPMFLTFPALSSIVRGYN